MHDYVMLNNSVCTYVTTGVTAQLMAVLGAVTF